MRAAGLRGELHILTKSVTTTDKFGAKTQTWVEVMKIHAERVKMSGRLSEEDGERFPSYSAEYNIRYPIHVEEHWRIQAASGGNLYEITNIVPNWDRQMKTLVCERVNE